MCYISGDGLTFTSFSFLHCLLGQHLKFEDEVESLQVQVDKLHTLGYNKIIALGHSGFEVDQDIAKRVRGVDVVIGGHTNTFLYTGTHTRPRPNVLEMRHTFFKN